MGGTTFITYARGADPDAAFRAAVERAQYDYGHAGYTGTIAEKDSYVIVDYEPRSKSDAEALAHTLIHDLDYRIRDTCGPAGAIPVRGDTDVVDAIATTVTAASTPDVVGWLFFGWATY